MIGEYSILKEEFDNALRGLKENKAPGVNPIAVELLQNLKQAEKIILHSRFPLTSVSYYSRLGSIMVNFYVLH